MSTPVLHHEPAHHELTPALRSGIGEEPRSRSGVQAAGPSIFVEGLATQTAEGRPARDALQARGIDPSPARSQRAAMTAAWPSARPGQLLAARAQALFTSDLSAQCDHTQIEVVAAIRHAIRTHHGLGGCAAEVAAAYGEHPETAARRMRWARAVIEGINAPSGWPGASS